MFELAYLLHVPIEYIRDELAYDDFIAWQQYFVQRPVQWREDVRAFKLFARLGDKSKPEDVFESLATMKTHTAKTKTNLENSALFKFMKEAKGGTQIPL